MGERAIELMRRIDRFSEAPKSQFTEHEWKAVEALVASGLCRFVQRGSRVAVALTDAVRITAARRKPPSNTEKTDG